jgi:RsiW-degrading membrane proteinase PrsW (M82 family)
MRLSKDVSHWADIAAIPLFFLLSLYFYRIPYKTPLEWVLFAFSLTGLCADILFTYSFMTSNP